MGRTRGSLPRAARLAAVAAALAVVAPSPLFARAESTVVAGPVAGTVQYTAGYGIPTTGSWCNSTAWTFSGTHASVVINLVSNEYAGTVALTGSGSGYCAFLSSESGYAYVDLDPSSGTVGVLQCGQFSGPYTRAYLEMDLDLTGWCAVDYQDSGLVEVHVQLAMAPSQVTGTQVTQAVVTGAAASYTASTTPAIIDATVTPTTTAGGWIEWQVDWLNPNSDREVRAVICRTAAIDRAGNCLGGYFATSGWSWPSLQGSSWADYLTSTSDNGTQSFFAFACDDQGICSPPSSGSFVVTPNNAPVITSATTSSNPVVVNSWLRWTVSATDPNGDGIEYLVCKTNQVDGWGMTCPGGTWGGPDWYEPDHLTTSADIATSPNPYYAFACDTSHACSGSIAGTFTVAANGAPAAVSATVSPNPIPAGTDHTFTISWSDANLNQGDEWVVTVCKSANYSSSGCADGYWSGAWGVDREPFQAPGSVTTSDVGTRGYWVFVCDLNHACAAPFSGTFTVTANTQTPAITAASVSPNPVTSGNYVTFSASWFDADVNDEAELQVCQTDAITSYGGCAGGYWASSGWRSRSNPLQASHFASTTDAGVHAWYAFVCDPVEHCSASWSGTFTVL